MRRVLSLVLATATSLALAAVLVGPGVADATTRNPAPKVSPSSPTRGSTFTVSGRLTTLVKRPVQLQRKSGKKWVKLAAGTSAASGEYSLRATTTATTLTVRVVAKRVRIKKKTYKKIITGTTRITTSAPSTATPTPTPTPSPTTTPHLTATAISASGGWYSHTCALISDGTVRCWGSNSSGELGNRTTTSSVTPVRVADITTATAIATGPRNSCALLADHSVWCWGDNDDGQLGNGTTVDSSAPLAVPGITNAVAIAIGGYGSNYGESDFACAVLNDGSAKCWGSNGYGQLGNGTKTPSTTPTAVAGLADAVDINSGQSERACVRTRTGTVKCWGEGLTAKPATQTGITNVIAVGVGGEQFCAVTATGALKCWGGNRWGEVVDDGTITDASAVAAGGHHTCAVVTGGRVKCWGWNYAGQLGNGTTADSPGAPTLVTGLSGAVAVTAGYYHTCALLAGGTVECWGEEDLIGGGGTSYYQATPVGVVGIS